MKKTVAVLLEDFLSGYQVQKKISKIKTYFGFKNENVQAYNVHPSFSILNISKGLWYGLYQKKRKKYKKEEIMIKIKSSSTKKKPVS